MVGFIGIGGSHNNSFEFERVQNFISLAEEDVNLIGVIGGDLFLRINFEEGLSEILSDSSITAG